MRFLLAVFILSSSFSYSDPYREKERATFFDSLLRSSAYSGAGIFLTSAALMTGVSSGISTLTPWSMKWRDEYILSSEIFATAAARCFSKMFTTSPLFSFLFTSLNSSYLEWDLHKRMLSEIPVFSKEDQNLVAFLERRWLAKCAGSFPFVTDWMCPLFGISMQVHPETTNSYARDPHNKISETYQKRMEEWKKLLPHPSFFPLILTRPANIGAYFPKYFEINKELEFTASEGEFLVLDLTPLFSETDSKDWAKSWSFYERVLLDLCIKKGLNPEHVFLIERVSEENIGGIRLLPFSIYSLETIKKQEYILLEWVSRFGLSATRIELDRLFLPTSFQEKRGSKKFSKESWITFLDDIEKKWDFSHPQKTLLFKATLQVLKDLLHSNEKKWIQVAQSPTRFSALQTYLRRIQKKLFLAVHGKKHSFYDLAALIEQVHADIASLLELVNPYQHEEFEEIFKKHLISIPEALKTHMHCGIHASGMTSLIGVIKNLESSLQRTPSVLYGENTYFECIKACAQISHATLIEEASAREWQEVDLILAQFNPVLRRIDLEITEYKVEKIHEVLLYALRGRERPLTIALDCTLDLSDSPRVAKLLEAFQEEILTGKLNVICFRSGLKFDLFGMDNYCGAPFFMIHNQEKKWDCFEPLLTDPALQADTLSTNWFCLVYQNSSSYLESYRKQVFENTRELLSKTPQRLLTNKDQNYRVVSIEQEADPYFIDIKIFGPFHEIRGSVLVTLLLTEKCMEAGHPLLYRPSLGFYHPNLTMVFSEASTTVRLTLGLDPTQIDIMADCLRKIDKLNGTRF